MSTATEIQEDTIRFASQTLDWALTSGPRILFMLLVAMIGTRVLRAMIRRSISLVMRDRQDRLAQFSLQKRRDTLSDLAGNVVGVFVWLVAILMILKEFRFDIGPILASAGVVGLAVSFGAQSLVKDVITGAFIILEGQYGVGDVIKVGDRSGAVESISIRTTTLRDGEGAVHVIPNGEITSVTVMTRGWSRCMIDVGVAYSTDLNQAIRVLEKILKDFVEENSEVALEAPEVLGVESLGDSAITIRCMLKVMPGAHWPTSRKLRKLIKETFDKEGIEIPFPQQTLWLRPEAVKENSETQPA